MAFASAAFFYSRLSKWSRLDRSIIALLFPLSVCLAALFFIKIEWSIYDDHNWERLQAAFALAHGFPLYHAPDSGPLLITIYGPVSMLIYSPAALAASPTEAMHIAELILMGCFFLPPLWIHLAPQPGGPKTDRKIFLYRLFIFFIFCYIPFISKPLRDAAFNIHVDGPTLGLASFACACLYFRTGEKNSLVFPISAAFAVLSVWSKQVAAPLLAALPIYLMIADGRRIAFRYIFYLFIFGTLFSVFFLWIFNPGRMIFNMFVIPSHQELRGDRFLALGVSTLNLLGENIIVLVLAVISFLPALFRRPPLRLTDWIRSSRESLFLIVSLAMTPVSILGNAKVGGSSNTLSYTGYFLLLAATTGFLNQKRPQERSLPKTHGSFWGIFSKQMANGSGIPFFLTALAILFLCIEIPWACRYLGRSARQVNFAETAFSYIKKHPNETYFPRLNVLNIMAENKVYHAIAALRDREWAGLPVSKEQFGAYLPERMKTLAFQIGAERDKERLDPYLPDYTHRMKDPELPGFWIYSRERLPLGDAHEWE